MPIDKPQPSGKSSPDGLAYDVVSKIGEVIDAVNTLNETLTTESADALDTRVTAVEGRDELIAQADVADLDQTSSVEDATDLQAVADKVDEILAALRSAGVLIAD